MHNGDIVRSDLVPFFFVLFFFVLFVLIPGNLVYTGMRLYYQSEFWGNNTAVQEEGIAVNEGIGILQSSGMAVAAVTSLGTGSDAC